MSYSSLTKEELIQLYQYIKEYESTSLSEKQKMLDELVAQINQQN